MSESESDPASLAAWEQEWVDHHYRLAMTSVRADFKAQSVEVFERSVGGEGVESLAAGTSLTWPIAFIGTADEVADELFVYPPLHPGCAAEAVATLGGEGARDARPRG